MSEQSKRFLLVTWEGGGVIPPELGLARRLVARGHTVHVLSDSAVEEAAREAGCEFSRWQQGPDKPSLLPEDDLIRDWEFDNPLDLVKHLIEVFACGPQGRYAADAVAVIDRIDPHVVLTDALLTGGLMAAEARARPSAVLVPNILMRPTPGIPPIGLGFMPARGPIGWLRDRIMAAMGARLWRRGMHHIDRARAELGLEPVDDIWAQHDRADKVLVMTSRHFDFEATRLPDNVRYMGPVLDDPSWAGDTWKVPWEPSNTDPIVLVGLSSTYQNQRAVLTNVVEALAGVPVRALVTLGPALAPDAVVSPSPNVVVVPTAPHRLVLEQASLVVSHCGHGTTIKTLAAGLPLVCIPMGRDQNDTAARVVARGAGVRLKPNATPKAIRKAVLRVLDDSRFTTAARALAAAMAREASEVDIVAEVEALASTSTTSGSSVSSFVPDSDVEAFVKSHT